MGGEFQHRCEKDVGACVKWGMKCEEQGVRKIGAERWFEVWRWPLCFVDVAPVIVKVLI